MEQLKRFLEKKPALAVYADDDSTLSTYGRRLIDRAPSALSGRLTQALCREAGLMGADAGILRRQLDALPMISTADHAGLLHYPVLFNANLVMAGILAENALPYQIVLASGRIPLDNASHPRGFMFQGRKFNFFPKSMKRIPVCLIGQSIPFAGPEDEHPLFGAEVFRALEKGQQSFLRALWREINHCPYENGSSFSTQIQHWNTRLWPLLVHQSYRGTIPKLLYFCIENILHDLICDDLSDTHAWLHHILFDSEVRKVYLEEFSGVYGCWGNYSGTHFFWGVGPNKHLHPLRLDHSASQLVPIGAGPGAEPIVFRPDVLVDALRAGRILPSLFIEILMLAFVEGYTLLGGFNQVDYATWMRLQHERCLLRLGQWAEAKRIVSIPTDGLICGFMPFSHCRSSLDLLWDMNVTEGVFNGSFENGLGKSEFEAMMSMSVKKLITNGIDAMLQVID